MIPHKKEALAHKHALILTHNYLTVFVFQKKMEKKLVKAQTVILRLSDLLLEIKERENLTNDELAIKCNISRRELCNIICRKVKGMRLETFMEICENANIPYGKVFCF